MYRASIPYADKKRLCPRPFISPICLEIFIDPTNLSPSIRSHLRCVRQQQKTTKNISPVECSKLRNKNISTPIFNLQNILFARGTSAKRGNGSSSSSSSRVIKNKDKR